MDATFLTTLSIGIVSYSGLLIFCGASWRKGITGGALFLATATTLLWLVAWATSFPTLRDILEAASVAAWIILLLRALGVSNPLKFENTQVIAVGAVALFACVLVVATVFANYWYQQGSAKLLGLVVANVCGLVLIEQLARNSRADLHWRIRYLNIGLGLAFSFNLVLYAMWLAVGSSAEVLTVLQPAVMALVTPFVAIASLRNRANKLQFNLSREFIFRSSVLTLAGVFLVALGLLTYFAQIFGGDTGLTVAAFFGVSVLLLFVTVIGSKKFRDNMRVVLAKTFFAYRYDYRTEWLVLTSQLTEQSPDFNLAEQVQRRFLTILNASSACIHLLEEGESSKPLSNISAPEWMQQIDSNDVVKIFNLYRRVDWVFDLNSLPPDGAELGAVVARNPALANVRFVIPLMVREMLYGVVLLGPSRVLERLVWEDYDLIKMVSRQCAGYLALDNANQKLIEQEQFSAVNQMSAFLLHDIKTIAAQLGLMLQNAETHLDNPEFVQDMLGTTRNSVSKMNRIIRGLAADADSQTRATEGPDGHTTARIDLLVVLSEWITSVHGTDSLVRLQSEDQAIGVPLTPEEAITPVNHLVQNALEASRHKQPVIINVSKSDKRAYIRITDTGPGMTREYIDNELFKPFSSSKGVSGMGIGAYQARVTIRKAGGEILVESEVGVGTQFTISLPI